MLNVITMQRTIAVHGHLNDRASARETMPAGLFLALPRHELWTLALLWGFARAGWEFEYDDTPELKGANPDVH